MKSKKLFKVLMATAVVAGAISLASCSGTKEATLTGDYVSTNNSYSYSNFLPTYNYFALSVTSASIKTYDDGTYVYSTYTTTSSNITTGADVPSDQFTVNSRGFTMTYYYGTYTAEDDSGLITLTLAAPTRVVVQSDGTYYDSANWTDAMGEAYVNANDYSQYTGSSEETTAPTGDEWLAMQITGWNASGESVLVSTIENSVSGKFEIIDLS